MATMLKTVSNNSQNKKLKNIYVPRPGMDSDEEDGLSVEENEQHSPVWHRYFEQDELLGRYEPIRELGRGAFGIFFEGKVKKCSQLQSGTKIAIKKVRRVFHTETDSKRLLRILRILHTFHNHDNILTLYDIIPPKDPKRFASLTLVFEFVDADLGKVFRTNQFFTVLHVKYILY
eukprot:494931_1